MMHDFSILDKAADEADLYAQLRDNADDFLDAREKDIKEHFESALADRDFKERLKRDRPLDGYTFFYAQAVAAELVDAVQIECAFLERRGAKDLAERLFARLSPYIDEQCRKYEVYVKMGEDGKNKVNCYVDYDRLQ